jgi:hypothetical protein
VVVELLVPAAVPGFGWVVCAVVHRAVSVAPQDSLEPRV